jgi:hypothetical protein
LGRGHHFMHRVTKPKIKVSCEVSVIDSLMWG